MTPEGVADVDAVREVVGHVHQIGWQLRLGEHIEGKSRLQREHDVPPATEEHIEDMRRILRSLGPAMAERMLESMGEGTKGEKLNNAAYAFELPENLFETVGKPGHEAEDRDLRALWERLHSESPRDPASGS